jgi:hypothetical protein
MTGIHVIQNKPALGANIIAALIKNDPRYNYRVAQLDDQACIIKFYEGGEEIGTSSFTLDDARKAGTKNLDKFPRNMLFARAMSNGAKWYTPGIFGGAPIYTPEELGADTDEDGNIIPGQFVETSPSTSVTPPPAKPNGHKEPEPINGGDKFDPVQSLVDEGLAENTIEASKIVNLSPMTGPGGMSKADFLTWARHYRGWRDMGADPKQAADKIKKGQYPE